MKQRLTEDFVKHLKLLVDRTGNSPHNIQRALDRNPEIAVSIRELDRLWKVFESHRVRSKRKIVVQAHPAFFNAHNDYRARWRNVIVNLWDWESIKAGEEPISDWLDREIEALSKVPAERSNIEDDGREFIVDDDTNWDFDPSKDSAAVQFEGVADYLSDKSEDAAFFSRASGAFAWLKKTMGIDVGAMERRWHEFPVIVISQGVSNVHGLGDPLSLFGYLDNVRLAYVGGAPLAAISMCRAATEIIIRDHYNGGDQDTALTKLIMQTQQRRECGFMKGLNLASKVKDANKILHSKPHEIRHSDPARTLILDWVRAIQILIVEAR